VIRRPQYLVTLAARTPRYYGMPPGGNWLLHSALRTSWRAAAESDPVSAHILLSPGSTAKQAEVGRTGDLNDLLRSWWSRGRGARLRLGRVRLVCRRAVSRPATPEYGAISRGQSRRSKRSAGVRVDRYSSHSYRQESVFDVRGAVAPVRRAAQLLPRRLADAPGWTSVLSDDYVPDLNLHLGAAHLAGVLRRFGVTPDPAYNPGEPSPWLEARGRRIRSIID